jgi:hypothetical protein
MLEQKLGVSVSTLSTVDNPTHQKMQKERKAKHRRLKSEMSSLKGYTEGVGTLE